MLTELCCRTDLLLEESIHRIARSVVTAANWRELTWSTGRRLCLGSNRQRRQGGSTTEPRLERVTSTKADRRGLRMLGLGQRRSQRFPAIAYRIGPESWRRNHASEIEATSDRNRNLGSQTSSSISFSFSCRTSSSMPYGRADLMFFPRELTNCAASL